MTLGAQSNGRGLQWEPSASVRSPLCPPSGIFQPGFGTLCLTHVGLSRCQSYQQTTLIYKYPNLCKNSVSTSINVLLAFQEAAIYLSPRVSQFLCPFCSLADGDALFHPRTPHIPDPHSGLKAAGASSSPASEHPLPDSPSSANGT